MKQEIELPNQESIRNLIKKKKLQILWNIRSRYNQANKDERSKERLIQKNKFIDSLLVRYAGPFLKWIKENSDRSTKGQEN